MQTQQEKLWSGEFGDAYCDRNNSEMHIAANIRLFGDILAGVERPERVIEFGANIGLNLRALRSLLPNAHLTAVEINSRAAGLLKEELGDAEVLQQSIFDSIPPQTWDLVLIKTVLIHVSPELLPRAYDALYAATGRYLVIAEYFNPTPVEVEYRGHRAQLFKRDFCGEILDRFPDLRLRRYGFNYSRDPISPGADENWFLLEKIYR
jgi:pseudaminic acid biosynthesis-associated methylase